jgi:hypothetical protein
MSKLLDDAIEDWANGLDRRFPKSLLACSIISVMVYRPEI